MGLKDFFETFGYELRDPEFASAYLDEALNSGDPATFRVALADVVRARGGFSAAARDAQVGRESLYKSLAEEGSPSFTTVDRVLHSVGLRLQVVREERVEYDHGT